MERAAQALARLEERARSIAVHFDVDVMDSAEIPLANWPHYGALSLGDAMRCLQVFVGTPKLAALVVTDPAVANTVMPTTTSRFRTALRTSYIPP